MSMMQPARFIKQMQKTCALIQYSLKEVSQAQATTNRDGGDGWTVLEAMCHVRDFDEIFFNRALLCYNQDNPNFPVYNHLQMIIDRKYAEQNLAEVIASYVANRQKFLDWLIELPEADWHKTGVHAEFGQITIFEVAMHAAHHDVDHLEQMLRTLAQ